jgi:polar amino acid transport system substrate-binding protein
MNTNRCPLKSLSHFTRLIICSTTILLTFISSKTVADKLFTHKLKTFPAITVVTEYLAPYQIRNSDGSLGGMATEIMYALFKEVGEDPIVHVMPWSRAYAMAKKNQNTLIFSIAHTAARSEQFQWIGSIMEEKLYFWSLTKQFNEHIVNIKQLKDYRVAASRHSNVAQYLIENDFTNINQLTKEEQNMLMLYKKRVDFIVATKFTLQKRAQKLGVNFDEIQPIIEVKALNNDLSFAFGNNTDIDTVKRFRKAYGQLVKNGVIEKIKHKWGVEQQIVEQ